MDLDTMKDNMAIMKTIKATIQLKKYDEDIVNDNADLNDEEETS